MSLATVEAANALAAALAGVTGLPAAPRRNDLRLADFVASGTAGIGFMLALADDDWETDAVALGGDYEVFAAVELLFAVEGVPGDDMNAVFNAGVEAIRDVLFPLPAQRPLTIPGAFENLRVGDVERHRYAAADGAPSVEALKVRLGLLITAPTPFG